MSTLIFPYTTDEAREYARQAHERGEFVVQAASEEHDDVVYLLPTIHDENFEHDFLKIVAVHKVKRILCPVASVHIFMRKFLAERKLDVDIKLIGESPIARELRLYDELIMRTQKVLPIVEKYSFGLPCLRDIEVAALLKRSSQIYGESNDEKIAAMIGIFADVRAGDVVEIGSLAGRTAFILYSLAWAYGVGKVLTIDPWGAIEGVQKDSPPLLTEMTNEWRHDDLERIFYTNIIPLRINDGLHLRLTSDDAFEVYDKTRVISEGDDDYYTVEYKGEISVIHIDGNHDYDRVKSDIDKWLTKMVSGGWAIIDDFQWCHGAGVTRAGNELLVERASDIEKHFVAGKALFIKFN